MSAEKCKHVLDFEETHCTICMKPIWELGDGSNRLAELEQKLTEHNGRFDNRCIDIETVLGINSKWEANNTKPFKQRIEALEKKFEISISNIDAQINTLNKESIDTNIIVRKTLDSWLEKNGERIVKEYVRKFDPSLFMELKFKENKKEISELKEEIENLNILYFDKKARYGYTNFYNRTHTELRSLREDVNRVEKKEISVMDFLSNLVDDMKLNREALRQFISLYEMSKMIDTGLLPRLSGEKSCITGGDLRGAPEKNNGSAPEEDSIPETIKSKLYCSICKSSVALDIIIDDGKRILVQKEDLKWLIEFSLRRMWHDGNSHTKKIILDIKERYKIDD